MLINYAEHVSKGIELTTAQSKNKHVITNILQSARMAIIYTLATSLLALSMISKHSLKGCSAMFTPKGLWKPHLQVVQKSLSLAITGLVSYPFRTSKERISTLSEACELAKRPIATPPLMRRLITAINSPIFARRPNLTPITLFMTLASYGAAIFLLKQFVQSARSSPRTPSRRW